uniref:Ubiquitin-like protease family profile domain-containing protein n=1 Tax=Oryza glumipatula TaxID=40148 RepID=A0A0E0BQ33_9ORYZ
MASTMGGRPPRFNGGSTSNHQQSSNHQQASNHQQFTQEAPIPQSQSTDHELTEDEVNLILQAMAKERLSFERAINDMEHKLLSKILTIQEELTEIKMHDNLPTRVSNLEADDYIITKEDEEVLHFVRNSYIWATVAVIADIPLAINFLLPNVNGGWLYDTVIDAYGYIANIANDNVGVVTTFQSNLLFDEFEDFDSRFDHPWVSQVGKICVMRHMVFVPFNVMTSHWSLLVVNSLKKEIQILNSAVSMTSLRDEEKEERIVTNLQLCTERAVEGGLVTLIEPINITLWKKQYYTDIPHLSSYG